MLEWRGSMSGKVSHRLMRALVGIPRGVRNLDNDQAIVLWLTHFCSWLYLSCQRKGGGLHGHFGHRWTLHPNRFSSACWRLLVKMDGNVHRFSKHGGWREEALFCPLASISYVTNSQHIFFILNYLCLPPGHRSNMIGDAVAWSAPIHHAKIKSDQ